MRKACKINIVIFILLLQVQYAWSQNNDQYVNQIMTGISNKGLNKDKPYLTAGDRTYIVGTQDGNFLDLGSHIIGSHIKGEMGGLWMQPVKLLDGFWLKLSDASKKSEAWLKDAREFINYPYGNRFIYSVVLNGIEAERFQFCAQGKAGMVVYIN